MKAEETTNSMESEATIRRKRCAQKHGMGRRGGWRGTDREMGSGRVDGWTENQGRGGVGARSDGHGARFSAQREQRHIAPNPAEQCRLK